ncbi:hypothetical protein C8J57DRAFT_1327553 [Mycena rebaudengoi]|nr:hypothetical protein C8J57DRAFT_1327553 [Mycena rebaudengoi]
MTRIHTAMVATSTARWWRLFFTATVAHSGADCYCLVLGWFGCGVARNKFRSLLGRETCRRGSSNNSNLVFRMFP